jgi:hypothetical protein
MVLKEAIMKDFPLLGRNACSVLKVYRRFRKKSVNFYHITWRLLEPEYAIYYGLYNDAVSMNLSYMDAVSPVTCYFDETSRPRFLELVAFCFT